VRVGLAVKSFLLSAGLAHLLSGEKGSPAVRLRGRGAFQEAIVQADPWRDQLPHGAIHADSEGGYGLRTRLVRLHHGDFTCQVLGPGTPAKCWAGHTY
jgi:hypothetical protein